MMLAIAIFAVSLIGIAALFALKTWELKHERVLFRAMRERSDARALRLKELLFAVRVDLAKIPPELLRLGRLFVHEAALAFARLARASERNAHRLADMASHKRHFERRETRSEFLQKIAEGRSGGLDTSDGNGHNT